jgi:bifunctional non-homologous end joining protein LigD
MSLHRYHEKRDFKKTNEPRGVVKRPRVNKQKLMYLIQKHAASHLHYDFRLELEGVLKSWAVPKGPSLDPLVKRLAVHVEDHPMEYGSFEGIIPKGEYGGGTVMLWDQGEWEPQEEDVEKAYRDGKLTFLLKGKRLKGLWKLVRMKSDPKQWLLMKVADRYAKSNEDYDITNDKTRSVSTRRTMEQIANDKHSRVHGKKSATSTNASVKKKFKISFRITQKNKSNSHARYYLSSTCNISGKTTSGQ